MSRSSAHQRVPKPLTRTQSVLPWSSHRCTFSRAAVLSLGATASSMSRTTMSARECAAGAKRSDCAPLTNSQLRASTGSMRKPGSDGAWGEAGSWPGAWSYTGQWSPTGRGRDTTGRKPAETGSDGSRTPLGELRPEEALHGPPVPFGGVGVVDAVVVGHRKTVGGRIELDGVLDVGRRQRLVQGLGLLGGEGLVVLGGSDVHRGADAIGQQVRAA